MFENSLLNVEICFRWEMAKPSNYDLELDEFAMGVFKQLMATEHYKDFTAITLKELIVLRNGLNREVIPREKYLETLTKFRDEFQHKNFKTLDELLEYLKTSPNYKKEGKEFKPEDFLEFYNKNIRSEDRDEFNLDINFFTNFTNRSKLAEEEMEMVKEDIDIMKKERNVLKILTKYIRDKQTCIESLEELGYKIK